MISDELKKVVFSIVRNKPYKESLSDIDLTEALERIVLRIERFCRLKSLPVEMKYTIADMVAETYDILHVEPSEDISACPGVVSSITQGDTSITFESGSSIVCRTVDDIMNKYAKEWLPYRSIYWR